MTHDERGDATKPKAERRAHAHLHTGIDAYISNTVSLSRSTVSNTPPRRRKPQRLTIKRTPMNELQEEMYFLEDSQELTRPLNHRNEAAAISLILQRLQDRHDSRDADEMNGELDRNPMEQQYPLLQFIRALMEKHCESLWPDFSFGDDILAEVSPSIATSAGESTKDSRQKSALVDFHVWAKKDAKIASSISVAKFGNLRGCAASRDLDPGDLILSIPRKSLIYDETIADTDLGEMLYALPGLSADNVLILFTMIDRHEETSFWAPFWRSLPRAFLTGLSFPNHLIKALGDTAAGLEIQRGQAHLRSQYDATRPLFEALLRAYPDYFQENWFSYESYAWAAGQICDYYYYCYYYYIVVDDVVVVLM